MQSCNGARIAVCALIAGVGLCLVAPGPQPAVYGQATGRPSVVVTTPTAAARPALPTPTSIPHLPTPTPSAQPPAREAIAPPALQAEATYVVQAGDTLLTVALEIGVDLDEMACAIAPDFTWDQPLVIGNVVTGPPPGAVCHQVQAGESLLAIADRYGVSPAAIHGLAWNGLDTRPLAQTVLTPGMHLRVPAEAGRTVHASADQRSADQQLLRMLSQPVGAQQAKTVAVGGPLPAPLPAPRPGIVPEGWPYGSGNFAWPTYGWLSQNFHGDHRAVDIAAPPGTLVAAADRGVVIRAGWNDQGYGNFVVIDHNIDYITLYAHLDDIFVEEGQVVAQGALLGTMGSTGRSTGPHLHFEIRDFGRRVDPIPLLLRDRGP